jgi:hypothetical protein
VARLKQGELDGLEDSLRLADGVARTDLDSALAALAAA